MNNPITTLSRERLESFINKPLDNGLTRGEQMDMARALLAVMDAKPTCWEIAGQIFSTEEEALEPGYIGRPEPLYETPPLPRAPDGWATLPAKLSADNGAKAALSGEFLEVKFISCPECFGDDDCDSCDGSGRLKVEIPVSWTTIKAIWEKGVQHFSALPAPRVD